MKFRLIATSLILTLGTFGAAPISQEALAAPSNSSLSTDVVGWKTQQTRLSTNQKSRLSSFVKQHKATAISASCIAFQPPGATKKQLERLIKRATTTCREVRREASWVSAVPSLKVTNLKSIQGRVRVNLALGPNNGANEGTIADKCKILSSGSGWNSVGFPVTSRFGGGQNWNPLPSSGLIKALVIGVDFPNYPGQTKPSTYVQEVTQKNSQFFEAMSYGAVQFEYTVLPSYVRMSKNAEDYGIGSWGKGDYETYYREALSNAAEEFEIGGYDVAYVMASPETPASAINPGPGFPWPENTVDGVVPLGTATGGMPLSEPAFRWMAHETGHLFGWVDLYDVSGTVDPNGSRHTRFGWWDIMSMNWETFSLEINGWFRFQVGWIKDSEVVCIEKDKLKEVSISVSNLASQKPQRLVVVRTGPQKVIVIERRSITRFAPMLGDPGFEGVLVYEVDGATNFQKAPVSIIRKNGMKVDAPLSSAALKPGEFVSIGDVKISVSSANSSESLVLITRSN